MKKKAETPPSPFAFIPVVQLVSNTYNARRFDDMTPQRQARFDELTASVRENGVIEPLLVRPLDDGRFEVIAGERRFRAAQQIVHDTPYPEMSLPCMVRHVSDDQAFDLMLIENLQREDLTPFETAQAFSDYLKRHGDTIEAAADLAIRTGIPVHAIRRQVRILRLPAEVVSAWKTGTITQSHAELFTRVGDEAQVIELLALCVRLKLSTRELGERIGAIVPDLGKGFFDKVECQTCHFNTSIQSGLFADSAPADKCGNPSCFEAKQGAFLTENWLHSKAAEKYGTRGFRFSHRLEGEHRQPSVSQETAERCLQCDAFVSLVRTTGAIVGMYERTCIGPRACFDELYTVKPAPVEPEKQKENETQADIPQAERRDAVGIAPGTRIDEDRVKGYSGGNPSPGKSSKKQTPPPPPPSKTETDPVYNAMRGERFRELFYKTALPETIGKTLPDCPLSLRLTLLSFALASPAARKSIEAALGLERHLTTDKLAKEVFEVPSQDAPALIQNAAVAHLLDSAVIHGVRRVVADAFGIDLAKEWVLSRDYLDSLTCSEVVRVGEEDGVGIWSDDKVRAVRKEQFKNKPLLSLKKSELLDLAINSGADLTGRVPAEVLGQGKG